MPKIFRQRDIDEMQASDVTQEFLNYYARLSATRKEELRKSRPDLVAAILSWKNTDGTQEADADSKDAVLEYAEESETKDVAKDINSHTPDTDSNDEISRSIYDGMDLPTAIKNGLDMVEALTVSENQSRCPVHREPFVRYNPTFRTPEHKSIGMYLYLCPKCNRLFIKESQFEKNIEKLTECNIEYNFYDKEQSAKYLKSITEPYLLSKGEKIYTQNSWVEENPLCIIHGSMLEELPCKIDYCSHSVYFDAYYCCECDKVILRRAAARDLEDKCSEIGIPLAGFEILKEKSQPKKPAEKRKYFALPNTIIENGKIIPIHNIDIGSPEQYLLNESDSVVVSDSIYCSLDGHDTKEVPRIIFVKKKNDGKRKPYFFKLGFCSDCEKYYMDEVDYKILNNLGRPEVLILLDVDDESYKITSGEVFDLENKHLGDLEDKINGEVDDIHNKPDYVGQYDTQSSYDDGGLAYAKSHSLRKYGPRLQQLYEYQDCPYEYRVDISCDDKSEVYYIGTTDIILNDHLHVISANDKFAGKLVNIGTTKIEKDGLEYTIKLTRQFDISNATLYGYDNIRTADDVIFRKGITDPFLIRVLKKRKQQHNLVDIFVTIQENQNAIVDADFGKNIIVQGCAGSGKTMVLLHRLSSLNYNRPDFNFVQNAIILTPNDNFTTHINGLASSLQIGAVERLSVEKYYAHILSEYSKDIAPTGTISSEMLVDQKLVDYIYSDGFRVSFDDAYEETITNRNKLIERIHDAEILMEEQIREINAAIDSEVVPQLSRAATLLSTKVTESEKNISEAQKSLNALLGEKKRIEDELPKKQASLSLNLRRLATISSTKGLAALAVSQRDLNDKKAKLDETNKAKENLEAEISTFSFAKDISSFDDFKARYSTWLDSSITDKARLLAQKQEKRQDKLIENSYLARILETPLDSLLNDDASNDMEISSVLTELSNEKIKLSELIANKEKLEKTWIAFGKAKKVEDFDNQIENSKDRISDCKRLVTEIYDKRMKQLAVSTDELSKLTSDIHNISREIQGAVLENMKRKRTSLKSASTRQLNVIEIDSRTLEKRVALLDSFNEGFADSDILAWLNDVSEFAPEVRTDIQTYNRQKKELVALEKSYSEMDDKIEIAKGYYEGLHENRYPDDIKKEVAAINKELSLYSDYGTFKMTIEKTLRTFKEENNIKMVAGKYHRYDLYAQLIFAMKFYKRLPKPIEFICVDEGQDLALNEYRLIKELNANNVIFNIFGDTNQLIKPNRGINDWKAISEIFETEQFALNENYRNTNQITRFCNDSFGMSMRQTGVDGPRVREITVKEFEYELSSLNLLPKERVAILISRGSQKAKYVTMASPEDSLISTDIEPDRIAIMYVDEVKGIEFDKIYVIPEGMGENEKYIAYTRALTELILVINSSISVQKSDEPTEILGEEIE